MNVFKSFEVFFAEPLSILRERIIQIVHVHTIFTNKDVPKMTVDLNDDYTQITVNGSEKMYNLLTSVIHKKRAQNENQKGAIPHKLTRL